MSDKAGNGNVKRKRKDYFAGGNNKPKWQPKRGGPGVILTCDTGRDKKAQREGIQILNHYYKLLSKQKQTADDTAVEDEPKNEKLTLDDELKQLQSENKVPHRKFDQGPFAVYETGCRGTVFVICTLPDCNLVPMKAKKEEDDDDTKPKDGDGAEPESKKAKSEETKSNDSSDTKNPPPWDPTESVRRVMNDLQQESVDIHAHNAGRPGSRFVARMIPMQATCFASMDEITITFRALLDHWVLPKLKSFDSKTFAIKFKKRNNGNVTRDQVIDAVVGQIEEAVDVPWKVDLANPDYRVQVEVCKTLCGISILATGEEDGFMVKHNFNLADLRANAAAARAGPGKDDTKEDGDDGDKKEEDDDDNKE